MGLVVLHNDSIMKWKSAFTCSGSVKTLTVTNIN